MLRGVHCLDDISQFDALQALAQTCAALRQVVLDPRVRRRVVVAHGFPRALRTRCWQQQARLAQLQVAITATTKTDGDAELPLFLRLLEMTSDEEHVLLKTTGLDGEIIRDVERTFAMLPFFSSQQGDGQRQLANVLKAVAVCKPEIGYCQGMNYVAAAMLLLLNERGSTVIEVPAQQTAFWLMLAWIQHFDMAAVWAPRMPGLAKCLHLYTLLLQKHFPKLHAHFREIGFHPSLLATQWFATLFARVLKVEVLARVWDLVLLDGWKAIYRIALAITAHLEPHMISMDLEACSEFLRQYPRLQLETMSGDALVASAQRFKVTRVILADLENERHLQYLRLRLQSSSELSMEQSMLFPTLGEDEAPASLEAIRAQLDDVDSKAASDMLVLRQKIEAVDKTVTQTTTTLMEASYALTEITFAYEDQSDQTEQLQQQFDTFLEMAVREASTNVVDRPPAAWSSRTAALQAVQQRLFGCFERVATIGRDWNARWMTTDPAYDSDDEQARNLGHLEVLVPTLAADLRVMQRKLRKATKALQTIDRQYQRLHREWQVAQVTAEEAQVFKARLTDQVVQLGMELERAKTAKMQELFAQVDGAHDEQQPGER